MWVRIRQIILTLYTCLKLQQRQYLIGRHDQLATQKRILSEISFDSENNLGTTNPAIETGIDDYQQCG